MSVVSRMIMSTASPAAGPTRTPASRRPAPPAPTAFDGAAAVHDDGHDLPPVEEPAALDGLLVTLERRPPRPCALLRVNALESGRVRIDGDWGDDEPLHEEIDAPALVLGELAREGGRSPRDLVLLMREWSLDNPSLTSWLDRVRGAVGDANIRLTIWDTTPHEVPWELLYLYGDQEQNVPGGWLGAVVAVSRWITPRYEDRRAADDASDRETWAEGGVLGSVIEEMAADAVSLARFSHDLVDHDGLLPHLKAQPSPLALLYVACHGSVEASLTAMRLGRITLPELSWIRLQGIEAGRTVVVLNACHSGRMVAEGAIGRGSTFGFAEAFLRRGASVVVGATGQVGTTVAHRVADSFLDRLAAHPNLPVSVALTRARADIAAPVDVGAATDAQLEFFIYAFMLVAYGHCDGRVRLPLGSRSVEASAPPAEGGGGS